MDYLRSFLFGNYIARRKAQLEKEAKIDKVLCSIDCHQNVIAYLLLVRKTNRDRMDSYSNNIIPLTPTAMLDSIDNELDVGDISKFGVDNACDILKKKIGKN